MRWIATWKHGGNEGREKTRGTGERYRECRGNAGGAAQNRVAAGSGSASRLSLAIALVRRVKVGINGRRTLLGTRGVRWGTGELEEGPSRSVAGTRHSGGNRRRRRRAGVSSWVPKEEKLSWRTGTPCSSPHPSCPSLILVALFLRFPSSAFLPSKEKRRENTLDARARWPEGGERGEFIRPSGRFLSSLVHLSFRRRKLAERG